MCMYPFKSQGFFICILVVPKPWLGLSDPKNLQLKKNISLYTWLITQQTMDSREQIYQLFNKHVVLLKYLQCLNQVSVFSWGAAQHLGCVTDQRWAVSLEETRSNMYLFKIQRKKLKLVSLACTYERLRLCIQSTTKAQGMSIKTECTQLCCPHLSVSCHLKARGYPSHLHEAGRYKTGLRGENCLSEVAAGVEAKYFTDLNWHQTPTL